MSPRIAIIRRIVATSIALTIAMLMLPPGPVHAVTENISAPRTTPRTSVLMIGGPATMSESIRTTLTANDNSVERIAGSDRYATSAEMSRITFSAPVEVAFITVGTNFPDALAGAAAAGTLGGPVLLTHRDQLAASVRDELVRLRPQRVVILGGEASVTERVRSQVSAIVSVPVERVAGADRFATAAQLSATVHPTGADVVYLATGERFPDALVGAALAGKVGAPLLLARQSTLPSSTADELARLQPARVVVLGGEGAVGRSVVNQIAAVTGVIPSRIAGIDRYRTAAMINAEIGATSRVLLASGTGFADALVAGAVAAATGAGLLLTDGRSLSAGTAEALGISTSPASDGTNTGGSKAGGPTGGSGGGGGTGGGGSAPPATPAPAPVRFFAFTGDECTIVGTPGDDILIGTPGDDVICGLGGNDTIVASSGNDIIDGGTGNNTITYAAFTNDLEIDLSAGVAQAAPVVGLAASAPVSLRLASAPVMGVDLLQSIHNVTAGAGNDVVTGSAQSNIISGGPGNDVLYGGDGDNHLLGGDGDDVLIAGSGNNMLDGGTGTNTIETAWSIGLNTCVHQPHHPAALCLPAPEVTEVGPRITVTLPDLPTGWTPSMRVVFEIHDLAGTRIGSSSPGASFTPGTSHNISSRNGALAPDTEFRVVARIWDGMVGYPRYRTASEPTVVRTPAVDALPVLSAPVILDITSSQVTVSQAAAPAGWEAADMTRSFSVAVYQTATMTRVGASGPGSRYSSDAPFTLRARRGALQPGTEYCVTNRLYESVHRRTSESECVPFTTLAVDPLPLLPAPVITSVTPLDVNVKRPAQPASWASGWSIVARVFDAVTGRRVGQVGLGADFSIGVPWTIRAGIDPLRQDTAYCVTFRLFEPVHRRTTETACVPFHTTAAPTIPTFSLPQIISVESSQVTVEQPPRPDGWVTDWRFTARIFDSSGARVSVAAPEGGYAPGAPMVLKGNQRALQYDTDYCVAFDLYDSRYRHSTLSDCVPFRTGVPAPLPVFDTPVVLGATMSNVAVVQPVRPEGWVDHWWGRWTFSALIFDPDTMIRLGGESPGSSYAPGETFTLKAGTSLLQPDTEYCVAFQLYEGLHRRSTLSECTPFRTASATPLPTLSAPVISSVTWRDVVITHPNEPAGWTPGMRFTIHVVNATTFAAVGGVGVALTPGSTSTVTSRAGFLSGDTTYCVRFRVTDAVYSHRFAESPCTTFTTPPAEFAPTIASVSPVSGTALGGTEVTITGTDLSIVNDVRFGSGRATIVSSTDQQITVRVPGGDVGPVDVSVRSHGGLGTSVGGFTYLEPGRITGTLTDSSNQPLNGVSVIARDVASGVTIVTGSTFDGTYNLTGLPDGSYTLEFVPPFGSNLLRIYHSQTTVAAEATVVGVTAGIVVSGIDAVLPVAASLAGVVSDASNDPVEAATVLILGPHGVVATTSTSATGTWEVLGLGGGSYIIEVRPVQDSGLFSRFYPGATSSATASTVHVDIGGRVDGLVTVLPAGGTITGVVRDSANNPVAGATVAALPVGGDGPAPVSVTDADGSYTLIGLAPGLHTVLISPPAGSGLVAVYLGGVPLPEDAHTVLVEAGVTAAGVDVVLPAGGAITGVVTSVAGYALAGVTVSASRGDLTVSAVTGADGAYAITGLPEGLFLISFAPDISSGMRPQYYRAATNPEDALLVEARIGETTSTVDAVLQQDAEIVILS